MLWAYFAPVMVGLAVMWVVAWSSQPLPWSPDKPVTSLQRATEASIVGTLLGFAVIGLAIARKLDGQPEASENAMAFGGLALVVIGAIVAISAAYNHYLTSRQTKPVSLKQSYTP